MWDGPIFQGSNEIFGNTAMFYSSKITNIVVAYNILRFLKFAHFKNI